MTVNSSLGKIHHLLHDVPAALTDLGYILAAASPSIRRLAREWTGPRYRRLAGQYDRYVTANAGYFTPLLHILPELPEAEVIAGVMSAAGPIPAALPRVVFRRSAPHHSVQVHEYRAGAGVAWIIQG